MIIVDSIWLVCVLIGAVLSFRGRTRRTGLALIFAPTFGLVGMLLVLAIGLQPVFAFQELAHSTSPGTGGIELITRALAILGIALGIAGGIFLARRLTRSSRQRT